MVPVVPEILSKASKEPGGRHPNVKHSLEIPVRREDCTDAKF